ncbi:hypothetical protein D3C80_1552050 [compost metagenome]
MVGVVQNQRQQVLGQQDAHDVVEAFADHRVTRVRGVDDGREEFPGSLGRLDGDHLRTRDHDVAHLQVGDLDGAFNDGQRLAVQQLVLVRFTQQLEELLAVSRFVGKSLGDLFQPGLVPVTRSVFAHCRAHWLLFFIVRRPHRGRDGPVRQAIPAPVLPSLPLPRLRCGRSRAGAGSRG